MLCKKLVKRTKLHICTKQKKYCSSPKTKLATEKVARLVFFSFSLHPKSAICRSFCDVHACRLLLLLLLLLAADSTVLLLLLLLLLLQGDSVTM